MDASERDDPLFGGAAILAFALSFAVIGTCPLLVPWLSLGPLLLAGLGFLAVVVATIALLPPVRFLGLLGLGLSALSSLLLLVNVHLDRASPTLLPAQWVGHQGGSEGPSRVDILIRHPDGEVRPFALRADRVDGNHEAGARGHVAVGKGVLGMKHVLWAEFREPRP